MFEYGMYDPGIYEYMIMLYKKDLEHISHANEYIWAFVFKNDHYNVAR